MHGEILKRVKVSKLTTFSKKDNSNGILQLNIVYNRYNSIFNNLKKDKKYQSIN